MTVPLRKRIKRSVRSALVRAFVRLVAFVPLRPALAIATLVGRVGWRVPGRTRRQMLAQLEIAFPDKPPAAREAIGRASLVHLAWLAAEFATLRTYRARLPEYVSYAPGAEERFAEAVGRGKGVVFATGHVGNWELLAQRIAMRWPSAVIARTGNDPGLTALVGRLRAEGNPRPGDGHEIDFVEVPYDRDTRDRDGEAARLTAACTAVLEAAIRAGPSEWVWMHERWKTQPEPLVEVPQAKAVPKSAALSSS